MLDNLLQRRNQELLEERPAGDLKTKGIYLRKTLDKKQMVNTEEQ